MSAPIPPISVDAAAGLARNSPGVTSTEPGFANTYAPGASSPGGVLAASIPALGVGTLGALLLYHRYLQDKRKEEEKQANLESITAQLPGLHAKDTLLGAALGGGAGLAYDALASKPEGEKRLPKALKRILGGAALGATGANLVGDRARRYITNTQLPFSYGASGSILPKSFKQFWEGAVLDKPSFDPAAVQALANKQPNNKGFPDVLKNIIGARRELWRRSFGVHGNSKLDIWQKNTGGRGPDYYSLNESRKDYPQLAKDLFLPSKQDAKLNQIKTRNLKREFFANPARTVTQENAGEGWVGSDMFGSDSLVGGQQIGVQPVGTGFKGRVVDRIDVTPAKEDTAEFRDAILSGKIFDSKWRNEARAGKGTYDKGTNAAFMKSMLGRLLIDKGLTEEKPWVSQSFNMTPTPAAHLGSLFSRITAPSKAPQYDLQLTRETGMPATDPMAYSDLMKYLSAMRKGKAERTPN
jgi:hypothetical protein